jgi:histone RNA hairpin-binding protein
LDSNSNSNHDVLEIAFDDEENEKKFDKLVEEKKIKSPFKRTSSGNLELHTDNASFVEFKATYSENYDKNDNKKLKSIKSDRSNPSSSQESSRRDRRNYDDDYDSDELIENNPEILERRQKQIDYGKNTQGYENYLKAIPK